MRKMIIFVVSIIVVFISCSTLFIVIKNPFHNNTNTQSQNMLHVAKPIPQEALDSKFRVYILNSDKSKFGNSSYIPMHEWERSTSGIANWNRIEPVKGQYHWEYIDDYVKKTQADDNQILFTIWPYTNWDQEIGNSYLSWQKNDFGKSGDETLTLANRKGKPCDIDAYRKFLRLLVERYDGDGKNDMPGLKYEIKYWEIGNEPDLTNFFQGTDKDYFELLKESYTTIKEADPTSKVLIAAMPSLGYANFGDRQDFGHAEEVFKLGGGNYFDIMNYHAFGEAERLKGLLKKYNLDKKPYWITEEPPGYGSDYLKKNFTIQQLVDMYNKEIKNGAEKIAIGQDTYKDILPSLE